MTEPTLALPVIGYVRCALSQKFGVPRQPNLVNLPAIIEFIPPYNDALAFVGLEHFSHIWLFWQFHHNQVLGDTQPIFRPQVRPPRLGGNQKIGVFATRSMYRPSNMGLSVVKLVRIEQIEQGIRLHIVGGDMVDGTPVIDIKPYLVYSDSIETAKSGFASEKPLSKNVSLDAKVTTKLQSLLVTQQLQEHDITLIIELLAQDPRPAYRQQAIETLFTMRYRDFDIQFYQIANGDLLWCGIVAVNL